MMSAEKSRNKEERDMGFKDDLMDILSGKKERGLITEDEAENAEANMRLVTFIGVMVSALCALIGFVFPIAYIVALISALFALLAYQDVCTMVIIKHIHHIKRGKK